MDNSARNADQLLLAAGELRRVKILLGDNLEASRMSATMPDVLWRAGFCRRAAGQYSRDGEIVEQVIALKNPFRHAGERDRLSACG